MSFRWSKDFAQKAALYKKSMAAVHELCSGTVQGRFKGITVTCNGLGQVQDIQVDPSQSAEAYMADKQVNVQWLQRGVCEAMLDACEKAKLKKKIYWREVDSRQDYELLENMPPFPFDANALQKAPMELSVDHLSDGIYDPKYVDPSVARAQRRWKKAMKQAVAKQLEKAIRVEGALRREAFMKRVPLEELRKAKKLQAKRIRKRQAEKAALEEQVQQELLSRQEKAAAKAAEGARAKEEEEALADEDKDEDEDDDQGK